MSNASLAKFTEVFEPLCETLAASLSESIGQPALFDSPVISQEAISDLIADGEPLVQTTFSFPALGEDEGALLFTGQDGAILADLLGKGDGSSPAAALDDTHLELLGTAMAGFVQTMAITIGNAIEKPITPGPECATNLNPLTLSAGFLTTGYAVQIAIPYRVGELIDSSLRILLTPDLARAIAQIEDEQAADSAEAGINAFATDGGAPGFGVFDGADAFSPFQGRDTQADSMPRGMDLIMDIPLDVSVELGRVQMLIKDVLELATGSIVELERVAGEPIDLLVNGQLIAKGEVVVIEDNFGIRITEIISPADRLSTAGKRAA
jgi:flagellar motor switch protein FliN/FliY